MVRGPIASVSWKRSADSREASAADLMRWSTGSSGGACAIVTATQPHTTKHATPRIRAISPPCEGYKPSAMGFVSLDVSRV